MYFYLLNWRAGFSFRYFQDAIKLAHHSFFLARWIIWALPVCHPQAWPSSASSLNPAAALCISHRNYGAVQGKASLRGRAELCCWKSKIEISEPGAAPGQGQGGFQELFSLLRVIGHRTDPPGNGHNFSQFYFIFPKAFLWSWEFKSVQEVLKESCFQIM